MKDNFLPLLLSVSFHAFGLTAGYGKLNAFLPVRPGSAGATRMITVTFADSASAETAESSQLSELKSRPEVPSPSSPSPAPVAAAEQADSESVKSIMTGTPQSDLTGENGAFSPLTVQGLIAPEYPAAARRRGHEGVVVYQVTVTPDGNAAKITCISSSGYELLDAAAKRALADARFVPAKRGSTAVAAEKRIAFRFELKDAKSR